MTDDMIALAKRNAEKGGFPNVEFRLGEIEALPVDDNAVDVILSNCVINLVPDKQKAFAEAFRVLKPGGRLHVSDIVLTCDELPEMLVNVRSYVNCVAGAVTRAAYLQAMQDAGFTAVTIHSERDAAQLLGSGCCAPPAEEEQESGCCGEEPAEDECCCGEPEVAGCGCGASLLDLPEGLIVSMTVSAHKPL
jgi:SAM-dependent methyltransferase